MCRRKEVKEWEKIDPVGKPRKDDEDGVGDGGWFGRRGQRRARSRKADQKRCSPQDDEKRSQWGDCVSLSHQKKKKREREQ
jgi:hypothetical protein